MRLLFSMPRAFYPYFVSGADVANFEYLSSLLRRKIGCSVMGVAPKEMSAPVRYNQEGLSVVLWGSAQELLEQTCRTLAASPPDHFMTGCAGVRQQYDFEEIVLDAAARAGVPATLLARDIEETTAVYGGLYPRFSRIIANSHYVAGELKRLWNVDAQVVYSVPRPDRCQAPRGAHTGGYLTMFNPIGPKGIRTTLTLAAFHLKSKKFMIVEGWLPFKVLNIDASLFPNIRFEPRTHDVKTIYALTDVLLVPSVWQEPFGRVVLEGMLNGLPVAASAVGGIPEIMPDSPLLIRDFNNPEAWVEALNRLEDPHEYEAACRYSLERSAAFNHEVEMNRLYDILCG